MKKYVEDINRLTRQYNNAIQALEDSYDMEKSAMGWHSSTSLKRQYSERYEMLAGEYRNSCRQLLTDYKRAYPEWGKWRDRWPVLFVIGIICTFMGCTAFVAMSGDEDYSALAEQQGNATYWNADNIPIPYLQDATQFVSNPDSVLSQGAVNRMNQALQRLEKELGIQSVFIVVNHIENDDPFRMAQDVGNKLGVGYEDRGLVVVVGYQDHSINMSPGRSLEADLTDAECHRLEQRYVVPAMKVEMPDSGMIYLAEAVYSTLQKKELPDMSSLSASNADDDMDDDVLIIFFFFLMVSIGTMAGFLHLNGKYHWVRVVGVVALLPNPFYEQAVHISSGGGFGGFSGGGGSFGGGGGGSFGGGSFGGGGATSRW